MHLDDEHFKCLLQIPIFGHKSLLGFLASKAKPKQNFHTFAQSGCSSSFPPAHWRAHDIVVLLFFSTALITRAFLIILSKDAELADDATLWFHLALLLQHPHIFWCNDTGSPAAWGFWDNISTALTQRFFTVIGDWRCAQRFFRRRRSSLGDYHSSPPVACSKWHCWPTLVGEEGFKLSQSLLAGPALVWIHPWTAYQ